MSQIRFDIHIANILNLRCYILKLLYYKFSAFWRAMNIRI